MKKAKKQAIVNQRVDILNSELSKIKLDKNLKCNEKIIKNLFQNTDTIVYRNVENRSNKLWKGFIAYSDGLVNSTIINENIIRPIFSSTILENNDCIITTIMNQVILINEIQKTNDMVTIVQSITYGDTILFIDGYDEALILNTKSFETRAIAEPDSEKIIQGPKEGFSEALLKNLSMIRRRVRTNLLKMQYVTLGEITQTKACVCYIDGIVKPEILADLMDRLSRIKIDAIIDSNYVAEMIKNSKLSPFTTAGHTQRPDVVVGKLMEGRIALFVDGTPVVLTVPYLFIENFQNNEDYYLNFYYSSFSRLLRLIGFFCTIFVPAIYVTVVAYHFEMLPSSLLINFAVDQNTVPLPASLELFVLLVVFDILRETGVRMPSSVGQALSIVGALVIGDAAVNARLVASPTIIVVAIAGITNLLVPKMSGPVLIMRYSLLLSASLFGSIGISLGVAVFMSHIFSLESFGVAYVLSDEKLTLQNAKDTLIRSPWWFMKTRDKNLTNNTLRQKSQRKI
ncbi:spore germination protein [Paludicola sp. MB14-C6]|uniref:spore germination protein n=1 Tax=Paludihabitans sp. MB14-C6 TaxID=3070656 RepID=UPI0027DDB42C|nr:spore germination protein [Paludicola sp. MB14-C6]WMJ24043.1 spore germination protein [Paludicola sp. MB14-C6]